MESINSNNLDVLDAIPNIQVKKRIKREIKLLENNFSSIYFYIEDKTNLPVIAVKDEKYKTKNFYSITFNNNYPFAPPMVKIDFESYFKFLKLNGYFLGILKKIHGIHCLCCSTIICPNIWSPANTSNNIFLEISKYKQFRRDIINKIMADKIKKRFLIDDIDLDCWLF
jgi:ubiquitin-protein ligase